MPTANESESTVGFFDKADKTPQLQPISIERYCRRLDTNDVSYSLDDDGDPAARFDDGVFWFMAQGADSDIIHIRGRWIPTLTPDQFGEAMQVANTFNETHLMPKCYVVQTDEETVLAFADLVVDATYGVSDDQLDMYFSAATATAQQFYAALGEAFPERAALLDD